MGYFNYSVSFGKGKLYQKSKTPQDGFEEVTYGTANDKITYHKYSDSVKGVIQSVALKDFEFEGRTIRMFEIKLKDGEDLNTISAPLTDVKGHISDLTKSFISALKGAEKGVEYRVSAYKKKTVSKTNGKEYTNLSIYFNYDDGSEKGTSTGFISFNDVPKPIVTTNMLGAKTYNQQPVDDFYMAIMLELFEKYKFEQGDASTPTQSTDSNPAQTPTAQEPEDDLPF